MNIVDEMIQRVVDGQDPADVLEGTLRQKSSIATRSRASLSGRDLSRKSTSDRKAGFEYQMSTEDGGEMEINHILKSAKTRGALELIPPGSRYPIAHVEYGKDGWIFDVFDPPDMKLGLPMDPEIRAASRRAYGNHSFSEARRMISLICKKVRFSSPLGSGLAVA